MFIVDHTAEGIISFSGSIDSLISPSHTYVSEGSVSIGGSSPIVVQNLFREASGGISITDSYSEVISPSHQYTANSYSSSQVEISGSGFSFVDYFNESIYRAIFNSDSCFNRIFIGGSAETSTYKIYEYVSQGLVSIAGSSEVLSSYYEYESGLSLYEDENFTSSEWYFQVDDTIYIHDRPLVYDNIKEDRHLSALLYYCPYPKYIYTNATFGHADTILQKMKLSNRFVLMSAQKLD